MSQTLSSTPADRLALIIEGLCHAVARRVGLGGLAGPLIVLIWTRLRRIAVRFAARAARHATTLSPTPSRAAKKRPARPRPQPLPRRKAWLLRLVPETASGASQLRHFLADPEVASLLAEAPQLRRILNPLCQMLGIRAAGIRPAQALAPSSPPDAEPIARLIPCRTPPPPAAPQAILPAACLSWATPPPLRSSA